MNNPSIANPERYFITQGSFKSLTYQFHVLFSNVTVELCHKYYDNDNLRLLLTDNDFIQLWLTHALFTELDSRFIEEARKKRTNMQLLFDSHSAPKYHKFADCSAMHNDYINFEIPPEIEKKGMQAILACKQFAYENRHILNSDEQKFIDRLTARFMLVNPPKKLTGKNTGRYEFTSKSLEEIKVFINETVERAKALMNENREVYNKRYKPAKHLDRESDDVKLWLMELKPALMMALFHYGIKKFGPADFSFEKSFLEICRFEPCKICCK
ncbi:hypothetical protein [Musicola paradisiaca]|uniref:Uncharacterized protein n=1 Tax=Musicola paradisiaca (strain Ech703) TaxID=579405 RepID=C6C8Z6_MUSP7|nr:hypothetical protein [Musicola paradisiaca]ACS86196.1 hypothetical protein Dd703_2414 [Musicola paradisiaca Ech703]